MKSEEEKILWINRTIAILTYMMCVDTCERYNLRPWVCFTFAVIALIGLSFIFAIVERVLK